MGQNTIFIAKTTANLLFAFGKTFVATLGDIVQKTRKNQPMPPVLRKKTKNIVKIVQKSKKLSLLVLTYQHKRGRMF